MKSNYKSARIKKTISLLLSAALACSLGIAALAGDAVLELSGGGNTAPIAENLEYTTFRGVPLTGRFKAFDPDGDDVTFEITEVPKKGAVTPCGGGEFVYTPSVKAKGRDRFSYVAVDSNGGVSASAVVSVSIKKQSVKTTYADMGGSPAHYAALALSERGIFTGEKLGDEYFFRPNEIVTRGEFLAMCLKTADFETLDGVTRTGFYDDGDIPMWAKPYVSAALMQGIVSGYRDDDGRIVFAPNSPVTFSEAAVMLNKSLAITDTIGVISSDPDDFDAVPAWARVSAANLTACGVLPDGIAGISDKPVTRADAARLLQASAEVLEARGGSGGLLGWAK
ncbi:MAG: S-layer homology domain-containing protein [Oscillospiraceae bacterium]|jgi:hypothetical protein|nr:S-layer homology domain-containing protein [Oscillospiraceae bacterium]